MTHCLLSLRVRDRSNALIPLVGGRGGERVGGGYSVPLGWGVCRWNSEVHTDFKLNFATLKILD